MKRANEEIVQSKKNYLFKLSASQTRTRPEEDNTVIVNNNSVRNINGIAQENVGRSSSNFHFVDRISVNKNVDAFNKHSLNEEA